MRFIGSFVTALLALSLAVTPAVARAAYPVADTPTHSSAGNVSSPSKMQAMPDCHRAMMQHDAQQPAKDTHPEKCPDCDKRDACNADVCQLKCFKVLGAVADAYRSLGLSGQRFYPPLLSALEPQSFKPQPPPPRV